MSTSTVSSKKKLAHNKSQIFDRLLMVATERTTLCRRNPISRRIPRILRCWLKGQLFKKNILCLTVTPLSAPPTHCFAFLSGLFISLRCFHFLYFLLLTSSTSHLNPSCLLPDCFTLPTPCSFLPPQASPWETIASLWRCFSWACAGPHRTAEKRSAFLFFVPAHIIIAQITTVWQLITSQLRSRKYLGDLHIL